MQQLSASQVIIIGLVATVLVEILKFVAAKFQNVQLTRQVVSLVAFVVSLALALAWLLPSVIVSPDPMQTALDLLQQAAEVLGFATLVYNLLLAQLLEKLEVGAKALLQKRRKEAEQMFRRVA